MMLMKDYILLLGCGAVIGFWLEWMTGLLIESAGTGDLKEQCRKQHNVYECVTIAIPKDKEGVYK